MVLLLGVAARRAVVAAAVAVAVAPAGGAPAGAQQPVALPDGAPACAPADSARCELARRLDALLEDPALRRAHVGLAVQVAESGEVLYARNAERRFTAASTTKLVTAAVALDRLGPEHRWRTRVEARGERREGRLVGDLWVVGGGDPTLSADALRRWAGALRRAGIGAIAGDVVADDRAFPGPPWGRGWMWDDLYGAWAAGVSALQLSPATVPARLEPGPAVGSAARLRFTEPGPRPDVVARVSTGAPGSPPRLQWHPDPTGGAPLLRGWIPSDDTLALRLAPRHPTLHALAHLAAALADSGVRVEGRLRRAAPGEVPTSEATAWSDAVRSPPLHGVLERLLRQSDNQLAETLLLTLGREAGRAGTAEEGLRAVEETLGGWGIEPGAVSLADGSGLSRYNELAPAALARLLRRAWQLPAAAALREALPRAARDGTLARRFTATAAEDNARAKTGSLSAVRALAGYVTDADGETLVFALLLNAYDAPDAVAVGLQDLLVEQLALYHGPSYAPSRR